MILTIHTSSPILTWEPVLPFITHHEIGPRVRRISVTTFFDPGPPPGQILRLYGNLDFLDTYSYAPDLANNYPWEFLGDSDGNTIAAVDYELDGGGKPSWVMHFQGDSDGVAYNHPFYVVWNDGATDHISNLIQIQVTQ